MTIRHVQLGRLREQADTINIFTARHVTAVQFATMFDGDVAT